MTDYFVDFYQMNKLQQIQEAVQMFQIVHFGECHENLKYWSGKFKTDRGRRDDLNSSESKASRKIKVFQNYKNSCNLGTIPKHLSQGCEHHQSKCFF